MSMPHGSMQKLQSISGMILKFAVKTVANERESLVKTCSQENLLFPIQFEQSATRLLKIISYCVTHQPWPSITRSQSSALNFKFPVLNFNVDGLL